MLNFNTAVKNGLAELDLKIEKIYNENTKVYFKLYKLDKNKYLEFVNYKLPEGFEYLKSMTEIKPIRLINNIPENRFKFFVKLTYNPEFCLLDYPNEIFKLYPDLPNIAISKSSNKIICIKTGKIYKQSLKLRHKYKTITINRINHTVHRLVGLTWCDNNDYIVKYIVDHKDGNKLNNNADNLHWVSQKVNIARISRKNKDDNRWLVYSQKQNKIFTFPSMKELGEFLGIPYNYIVNYRFPHIFEINDDLLIVEDRNNFTNWSLFNKLSEYGYRYKLISDDTIKYFKSSSELAKYLNKYYGLTFYKDYSVNDLKKVVKKFGCYIQELEPDKKIYNQHSNDKPTIQLKNLETGEILEAESTRNMSLLLGKQPTFKSSIIARLNGNKKEGLPLEVNGNSYLVRYSNKEWPKLRKAKNKRKEVYIKSLNRTFSSIREAARALGINKSSIHKYIDHP